MPAVDHTNRELLFKIVYYGPGLGGKTTNLEYIYGHSQKQRRGKLLSLCSESERTLFFDLLPIGLGRYKGYSIRLHLCTVPGQVFQDRIRKLVLTNVDGVVFVADSQEPMLDSNALSFENLCDNLQLHGLDPKATPLVVQYNKRDLDTALELPELRRELGVPRGTVEIEASARYGIGVFETLKAIVTECLSKVGEPRALASRRASSILPGRRASGYPGATAARGRQRVELPPPPPAPSFGAKGSKSSRSKAVGA
ncbi:MAG TPA: GTPase domain-containing protein [Polyangiaceae bacterium]|jgi:hypothetical protein